MDANMQQIMYEAERNYYSRNPTPSSSSPVRRTDSPHLDSIIYYEHPDTPRRRKRIFSPHYKDVQHNRHINRLQTGLMTQTMMKAAATDAHNRIAHLNENFATGGTTVLNPSVLTGVIAKPAAIAPSPQLNNLNATPAVIDHQVTNLFSRVLQQQPTVQHLQNPPIQNQIAEAFVMQYNEQPMQDPNDFMKTMSRLIINDIREDNIPFPARHISPNGMYQAIPNHLPQDPNVDQLMMEIGAAVQEGAGGQSIANVASVATQFDLTSRNMMQSVGSPVQNNIAGRNISSSAAKAVQQQLTVRNSLNNNGFARPSHTNDIQVINSLGSTVKADSANINILSSLAPAVQHDINNGNIIASMMPAIQNDLINRGMANNLGSAIQADIAANNIMKTIGSAIQEDLEERSLMNSLNAAIHTDVAQKNQLHGTTQRLLQSTHQHATHNSQIIGGQLPVTTPNQYRMVTSTHIQPSHTHVSHRPIHPNSHAMHVDSVIPRPQVHQHSSNLIVHQPNTTLYENQVFNFSGSMPHGGIPPPTLQNQNGFIHKEQPVSGDMVKKIADIQTQIEKLATQLKQNELKDTIREQRLQSVLTAKQKQVSKREMQMKKSEMLLYQLKQEKSKRAAHIETLKLEIERLRRDNVLKKKFEVEQTRGQVFQSFGKQLDEYAVVRGLGTRSLLVNQQAFPKGEYEWASDRLINSVSQRSRIYTDIGLDRNLQENKITSGHYIPPRSRSPSPDTYSIIENITSYANNAGPSYANTKTITSENLFTNELSGIQRNDGRLMKVQVNPIMAQSPIKTITTIKPVSDYRPLETLVAPPLVIAPNVKAPIVSTVFQERLSLHGQISKQSGESSSLSLPSKVMAPSSINRQTFGVPQPTILIQDYESLRPK